MDLTIQGVPVHFPYKPYGCQLSMLNRIISALNNKKCCLLESPTGTGKTLALLCGALAWIEKFSETIKENALKSAESFSLCSGSSDIKEDDDDSFISNQDCSPLSDKSNSICLRDVKQVPADLLPKIFFGTRTHKQISQIIRELRKTKYANVRMCILSSRNQTCINPTVRRSNNINEACRELTSSGVCEFDCPKKRSDLIKCVQSLNSSGCWNLEEYVDKLSQVPTCPYFYAFKQMESAKIVFCPYNYLLDPVFRETVSNDLKGSVIILDEAHNIEDAAREATSCTLLLRDIIASQEDLNKFLLHAEDKDSFTPLLTLLTSLQNIMEITRSRLVSVDESANSSHVWSGSEIEGLLQTVGLAEDKFRAIHSSFKKLEALFSKDVSSSFQPSPQRVESKSRLLQSTMRLFEYIFTLLHFLYGENMHRMSDYRAVLTEVTEYQNTPTGAVSQENFLGTWLNKSAHKKMRLVETRTLSLNFWCLNPAICMSSLASTAHSLILASGTLSPLNALAAELGLDFPVRLEANHVVPADHVFAASISKAPSGNRICATYSNQNSFTFQDDIGSLILESCRLVPGGVLCFFPSYSLLDRLVKRWELTGLLDELALVKHILQEPRSSTEFEAWMTEFYEAIDSTRLSENESQTSPTPSNISALTGALALAVCRGKVSEGLDFSDDYARLVIAVGIPFPAFKNPQVEQKRIFNDALQNATKPIQISSSISSPTDISSNVSRSVLSGSEWYEAQAYRALNQALGRCIRHRNDWGAVILADARFAENPSRYLSGISRWLRTHVVSCHNWPEIVDGLSVFVKRMQS